MIGSAVKVELFICLLVGIPAAYGQHVLTRILPSDELVLPPPPSSPLPHLPDFPQSRKPPPPEGRAVVWCMVQDLHPQHHRVQSLELFFKSAPQVTHCPSHDTQLSEGSLSQLVGLMPAAARVREGGGEEDAWNREKERGDPGQLEGNLKEQSAAAPIPRSEGFPEAQFTGDAKDTAGPASTNQHPATPPASRGPLSPDGPLDRPGLLPGSVTVARVTASASAELGVQHVQRSGVSVRGVISTTNPNLSLLQVTMERAQCSDCGTYVCVLTYVDTVQDNVTVTHSTNQLTVAQSIIHRLNLGIKRTFPSSTTTSHNSGLGKEGNNSAAPYRSTDLFCFGTVSQPSISILWRRQSIGGRTNDTELALPTPTRQGEPRLGQNCQHWRASLLRHDWNGSDVMWRFHCFLSRDRKLSASALISGSGSVVTATCGDPNSTTLTTDGDTVTVICDIQPITEVRMMSWLRRGRRVGGCDVTQNMTRRMCYTSEAQYTVTSENTHFVLTIQSFDVTRDKGLWECLVTPLCSDSASACTLG